MPDTYLIMVIDDMRHPVISESEGINTLLFRTPDDGLQMLKEFRASKVKLNELWLDHDMGINYETGQDITIKPVVDYLEELGYSGDPLDVDCIFIHTSNSYAGGAMLAALSPYYPYVHRSILPTRDSLL